MSGILDLLGSDLGKTIISGVAGSTGQDQGKTGGLLSMALPVLMKAMERNASTPKGAEGLMGAISSKHNGSILDNLGGLFGGGVDEKPNTQNHCMDKQIQKKTKCQTKFLDKRKSNSAKKLHNRRKSKN